MKERIDYHVMYELDKCHRDVHFPHAADLLGWWYMQNFLYMLNGLEKPV